MTDKIIVEFSRKALREMCKKHRKNKVVYPECKHCDHKSIKTLVECYLGFRISEKEGHIKGTPTYEDMMKSANGSENPDRKYGLIG